MPSDRLVKQIQKGTRSVIRVQFRTVKNTRLLDVRVFDLNAAGEFESSSKGLWLSPDLIGLVADAMYEAEDIAVQEGLVREQ